MLNLIIDIGGTNTRVALTEGMALREDTIRRFRNADHPGLDSVLEAYRADVPDVPAAACVCIAGPVREGVGTLTNLDWTISKEGLAHASGAGTTAVLNDLQAQGHAMGHIAPENLHRIVTGKTPGPNAARLVVNVGTGFNAAVVFDTRDGRLVPPSEAGHANLPVRTEEDLALLRFVETAHGFPAVEDVLSGRGL
ncbi:MAG: glucokinase, partial [Shimia sp.]